MVNNNEIKKWNGSLPWTKLMYDAKSDIIIEKICKEEIYECIKAFEENNFCCKEDYQTN